MDENIKYILKLYITGHTPRSEQAIKTLSSLCETELDGSYALEVVDVLEFPEQAENEKIMATPTLVRMLPPPIRRIIGDLSDTEKVLIGLDIVPETEDQ